MGHIGNECFILATNVLYWQQMFQMATNVLYWQQMFHIGNKRATNSVRNGSDGQQMDAEYHFIGNEHFPRSLGWFL